jgi:predicted nuclease of predicted toxin-antitoxin system
MKLLLDENLSFRLVALLADLYPDSIHIRDVGLLGSSDEKVWNYAAAGGFMLVSKDTDFYERSVLYGAPPKIVWLKIGNASVSESAALLRGQFITVRRFFEDKTATFLPLTTKQR